MVSLSRAWTVVLLLIVLVAVGVAGFAAYDLRRLVGFEDEWTCTLDPAWRTHLAWWLMPVSAALLIASAVDMGRAITGRSRGVIALPILVCVVGLAAIWGFNAFAFDGFDAGCSIQYDLL